MNIPGTADKDQVIECSDIIRYNLMINEPKRLLVTGSDNNEAIEAVYKTLEWHQDGGHGGGAIEQMDKELCMLRAVISTLIVALGDQLTRAQLIKILKAGN